MKRRMLLALVALLLVSAARAQAPLQSAQSGPWSAASTWGGVLPTAEDVVEIRPGHLVTADGGAAKLARVQAGGMLFLDGSLDLWGSLVVYGALWGSQGRLAFHVADDRLMVGNPFVQPNPHEILEGDTGLWAAPSSEVLLVAPPVTSWTWASSIGSSAGTLAGPVTGWQIGDTLLLSRFDGATATTTLRSISGSAVTYDPAGIVQASITMLPGTPQARVLRPAVANLSRRLQIVGADVTTAEPWHRAHTIAVHPATFQVANVELRNLGVRQKVGRYPLHPHHCDETSTVILDGNSIWQDVPDMGNRFVVIHESRGVEVRNNVGYRAQGHGYYMEAGTEIGNACTGNLSVDVRTPNEIKPPWEYYFQNHAYHFWWYANNDLANNVAVGPGTNYVTPAGGGELGVSGTIILSHKVSGVPQAAYSQGDVAYGVPLYAVRPYVSGAVFEDTLAHHIGANGLSLNKGYDPATVISGVIFRRAALYECGIGTQAEAITYGAGIRINQTSRTTVEDSVIDCRYGIHAHVDHPTLTLRDSVCRVTRLIKQRNWEAAILVENTAVALVNRLKPDGTLLEAAKLFQAHTVRTQTPPGIVWIADGPFAGTYSYVAKAGEVEYFGPGPVVPDGARAVAWPAASGFIRLPPPPPNKKWKWQVLPAGGDWTGKKLFVYDESEAEWANTLATFGGYPHGFPPGVYDVRVQHPVTLALTTRTLNVASGQVTEFGAIP